jgi:hypothetical protein
VIPNAIAITTYRKEYIFRSFWDRDEAFNMLKDLVNRYKGIDTTASSSSDPDGNMDMSISGPSTRVTSDSVVSLTTDSNVPPSQMNRRNSTSTVAPPSEGGRTVGASDQTKSPRPISMPLSAAATSQATTVSMTPNKEGALSPSGAATTFPVPAALTASDSSQSKLKVPDDNELDTGPASPSYSCLTLLPSSCLLLSLESGREELDRQRGSTLTSNTSEQTEAFGKDVERSKQKIQIKTVKMPISVNEFCQLFIVDGAKYGYPKYALFPS